MTRQADAEQGESVGDGKRQPGTKRLALDPSDAHMAADVLRWFAAERPNDHADWAKACASVAEWLGAIQELVIGVVYR